MRLLVTGTGRCGTTWIARALTAAGLPCDHEVAFTDRRHGEGGWQAEASWLAAPYLPLADTYTVHLVRDPLATIRSWAAAVFTTPKRPKRTERYLKWASSWCPAAVDAGDPVERAAHWWVTWNGLIVRGEPSERLRLEDVEPFTVSRLIARTHRIGQVVDLPAPASVGDGGLPPVTWDQVGHVPGLMGMARLYGYL